MTTKIDEKGISCAREAYKEAELLFELGLWLGNDVEYEYGLYVRHDAVSISIRQADGRERRIGYSDVLSWRIMKNSNSLQLIWALTERVKQMKRAMNSAGSRLR
ncbi:hypothetical protein KKF25_00760 [Patescibacteria group bacterium]|nr:hypothetical protein [Patescibacteria group bacterium]